MAFTIGRFHTDPKEHALTKVAGEMDAEPGRARLRQGASRRARRRGAGPRKGRRAKRGVRFDLGARASADVAPSHPEVFAKLMDSAKMLGIPTMPLASPASHDTATFTVAGVPSAMLFVRNANGSHNPREAMEIDDFLQAAAVLTQWHRRRGDIVSHLIGKRAVCRPTRTRMDAIAAFADHVVRTRFQDLPSEAVKAAKTFILDTLGVGLAGSSGPMACELAETQETWGHRGEARVWGNGKRLPAPAAAMCNAYQVHNSEFDCVHEEAVVHAMTVVLPVALAGAERMKGVNGRELITAVTLGVDVAAGLGVAASTGLRFFRPATAGAFGATAALGKLMGLDQPAMINAFSIAYGQCCGTMQAHSEGSMLLAMQMGFNARNAVVACDLAARGFDGPKNVLEGPFGYFKLIETGGDADARCPGSWPALVRHGTRAQALPFGPGHARHHRGLHRAAAAARLSGRRRSIALRPACRRSCTTSSAGRPRSR